MDMTSDVWNSFLCTTANQSIVQYKPTGNTHSSILMFSFSLPSSPLSLSLSAPLALYKESCIVVVHVMIANMSVCIYSKY